MPCDTEPQGIPWILFSYLKAGWKLHFLNALLLFLKTWPTAGLILEPDERSLTTEPFHAAQRWSPARCAEGSRSYNILREEGNSESSEWSRKGEISKSCGWCNRVMQRFSAVLRQEGSPWRSLGSTESSHWESARSLILSFLAQEERVSQCSHGEDKSKRSWTLKALYMPICRWHSHCAEWAFLKPQRSLYSPFEHPRRQYCTVPRNYLKPVVWQSQARLRRKERENVFRQEQCHIRLNDISSEEHAQIHL